jgi:hypothetical protein
LSRRSPVINNIAEELKNVRPTKKKILNYLFDSQLSDADLLDIIGETYKLNPLFFTKTLYPKIWKKMGKLIGKEGRIKGERYIVEKYCLHYEEKILYEFEGSIQKKKPLRKPYIKLSVSSGVIFITNERIIAQGKLSVKELAQARTLIPEIGGALGWDRNKQYRIEKKFLFEASELCFGYMFPVKDLSNLERSGHKISYKLTDGITVLNVKKENIDKIFEILSQFKYIKEVF